MVIMMTDQERFAEAVRRAVESDTSAKPDIQAAVAQAAKAVQNMATSFRRRSERVSEQLDRGAHLTRHRITL